MIVVDSSIIVAILLNEAEAPAFEEILAAEDVILPASCQLEIAMALRRKGFPMERFDAFIAVLEPRILAFDAEQSRIAVEADRRYGRATGHPAGLNFGDCMSYAAAIALGAPLMFKGDDFSHTDVVRAHP